MFSVQLVLDGYSGYWFGCYDEVFSLCINGFGLEWIDVSGQIIVEVLLLDVVDVVQFLVVDLMVWMFEGLGCFVECCILVEVILNRDMIGIKLLFDDIVVENLEVYFDVILFDFGLNRVEKFIIWMFNCLYMWYQWYQFYGNWNWEFVMWCEWIVSGDVLLGVDFLCILVLVEWGQYELVVESIEGFYIVGVIEFFVGWYVFIDVSEMLDMLELVLDKDMYCSGEIV